MMISFAMELLLTFVLASICILGDMVQYRLVPKENTMLKCLVDNGVHGLIGFFSWLIVVVEALMSSRAKLVSRFGFDSRLVEVLICGLISSFVDIDHFLAAGSFDIKRAISLRDRPILHCSTIPICLWLSTVIADALFGFPKLKRFGSIILVGFLSHHFRDAWRRGIWFEPISKNIPISYPVYVLLVVVLPHVVRFYLGFTSSWSFFKPPLKSASESGLLQTV